MMDLHCHTTASDGQYPPEQIIMAAKKSGISVLSITDHDTTDSLPQALISARQNNILFIPGIEINAQGKEVHILGYNIDYKNSAARDICESNKQTRKKRAQMILDFLKEKDVRLSWDDIKKYAAGGIFGRPHFALAMIEHNYVHTVDEAFKKYLDTPEFRKIKRPRPAVEEAIKMIKAMEGTPVLAHPALQKKTYEELDKSIAYLKELGLAGIECYHSEHSAEAVKDCLSLAQKHDLLVTGGSDFHGEKIKPDIKLGTGINNNLNFYDNELIEKLLS